MRAEAGLSPSPPAGAPARLAGATPPARCRPGRGRIRAAGLGVALAVLAIPVLTACGSASGGASADGAALSAACNKVGAALSDGPDPQADPVGYAEAQIKPLRAIQTSDHPLRAAIRDLAAAYALVFASNGATAASEAVTAAAGRVNAICPAAAP
jgi:hypothetical protein